MNQVRGLNLELVSKCAEESLGTLENSRTWFGPTADER
jgi:hypothetical protein